MKPSRLDVNGVDVAYRRAGSGPPVLYLHGSGLTRRWLPLYDELARSFDVIVPEHPGYGDTVRPAWYRSLDDFAPHYADLLTALDLQDAHVAGHSVGGLIAGNFAATYPERVRSLTLIAPGPIPLVTAPFAPPKDLPPGFDFDSLMLNDNQADYEEYRNADDLGRVVAEADDDFADPGVFSHVEPATLYRRLARVRCPAQVLVPDDDRLISTDVFQAWSHWLGDAPIVRIHGERNSTGHLLTVQEPAAIAAQTAELAQTAERKRG